MGQTERRRRMDARPIHRPCSTYYAGSVNNVLFTFYKLVYVGTFSIWILVFHQSSDDLFCSLAVLDPRVATPFIPVLCHSDWLFHWSPVHALMLSTQAVCGLPRLHVPGIVPCIVSFSRQLPYWVNEYFIHQHRYNTVKTVKSRTVSTEQKGSKSTYNCPKRYINKETHCTKTKH